MDNVFELSDYRSRKNENNDTHVPDYNPINLTTMCENLVSLGWSYCRDPEIEENSAVIDFNNKTIRENCPAVLHLMTVFQRVYRLASLKLKTQHDRYLYVFKKEKKNISEAGNEEDFYVFNIEVLE